MFCFFVFTMALFSTRLSAQEKQLESTNDIWLFQLTRYSLNPKWMIGNELHLRRHNGFKDANQFLIRPFAEYTLSKEVQLASGFTYIGSESVSEISTSKKASEWNFWQQIQLQQALHKQITVLHRFRLEERWYSNFSQSNQEYDPFQFATRFRYRFSIIWKFNNPQYYVHAFDEVWLNLRPSGQINSLDRNWLNLNLGYNLNEHTRLELGYLDQWISHPSSFDHIPTAMISCIVSLHSPKYHKNELK